MVMFKTSLLLATLASAQAFDLGALRGGSSGEHDDSSSVEQFSCSIAGASGQDACDAAAADDGGNCVWCSLSGYGFCLSKEQADAMEDKLPGMTCDDDGGSDDDDQAPPAEDDDTAATDDDAVPDDYWKCLKDSTDATTCGSAGCTWCDTKAGYGICMNSETAQSVSNYDFYDCHMSFEVEEVIEKVVKDPSDTACIMASLQGDASTCEATVDSDGQPCEWCTMSSTGLCLNADQADMADQFGADCSAEKKAAVLEDPYDPTCIQASLQEDESICEATVDSDGAACEWCMISGSPTGLCLNGDQADMAEQFGADCNTAEEIEEVEDPSDTACIMASLQGDASTCEATVDSDGQPCEWCTMSSTGLCLNADQADMADQFGADCSAEKQAAVLEDPYDPTCVQASLQGDESICEATVDSDGAACEWCMISGSPTGLCLNGDQAEMAEQFGADCNTEEEIEDPSDTACIMASLQGDESTCEATVDSDGQPCEWCTMSSTGLCLNADQADMADQFGADCSAEKKVLQDPYDITCIQASMPGQAVCEGTRDADGQGCEWCMLEGTGFCVNLDQADVASEIGADCGGTEVVATTA